MRTTDTYMIVCDGIGCVRQGLCYGSVEEFIFKIRQRLELRRANKIPVIGLDQYLVINEVTGESATIVELIQN